MNHIVLALLVGLFLGFSAGISAAPPRSIDIANCIENARDNGDSDQEIAWQCNIDASDIHEYED